VWKTGTTILLVKWAQSSRNDDQTLMIRSTSRQATDALERIYSYLQTEDSSMGYFDKKIDKASSDLYFYYYGMLQHQQNMLQDYIRTGTYFAAITENEMDFNGKVVMDVGCGSGILSLFAAQAGAKVIYAVEASSMAEFAIKLVNANPELGRRIKIIQGKVEEVDIPEKIDVLISEPMGTMLVNERMLESYFFARDRYLTQEGKMFPNAGTIYISAFTDDILYDEMTSKSLFWQQNEFYGVDLTCLHQPAYSSYFTQVVIDQIPPHVLVSNCCLHRVDFATCSEEDLYDFEIPLELQIVSPCAVHGIATWFDVNFDGSAVQRVLSTAPDMPVTHWFQLRCVLQTPITISKAGDIIKGKVRLKAHERQSYDIFVELTGPPDPTDTTLKPQFSSGKFDLKEPYYRQLTYAGQGIWDGTTDAYEQPIQEEQQFDPNQFLV